MDTQNILFAFLMVVVVWYCGLAVAQQNNPTTTTEPPYCVEDQAGKLTYAECESAIEAFVVEPLDSVFTNHNPWVWLALDHQQIVRMCRIYEAVEGQYYLQREDFAPNHEKLLADGFHDMMDYMLCSGSGAEGYQVARPCLADTEVQQGLKDCFTPYENYTDHTPFRRIEDSDDLIHQHCDVFKTYQQCRIDLLKDKCDEDVADWNNDAIVEYYEKLMNDLHCDIDMGLSTKDIIFIVIGCLLGILFLFCLCFCCTRVCSCVGEKDNAIFRRFTQKEQQEKKKPAATQNGVVNKGYQNDAEKGKAAVNGGPKAETRNEYYNTRERDNNTDNERKQEQLSTIDERSDEKSSTYYKLGTERDYRHSPRDTPRDSPRDSPRPNPRQYPRDYDVRDSPRASPMQYPRDYQVRDDPRDYRSSPRDNRRPGKPYLQRQASYDKMIQQRLRDGPPPRNMAELRADYLKPRGLNRY